MVLDVSGLREWPAPQVLEPSPLPEPSTSAEPVESTSPETVAAVESLRATVLLVGGLLTFLGAAILMRSRR